MQVIFVGLVLFCFLGTGIDSVSVPRVFPGTKTPSTTTVPPLPTEPTPVVPTDVNATADDTNSTMAVLQITDYHYFDWPKIGYQIFMQKMLSALQTLKFFMSLDPMILKITRTYVLTNDTNFDYDDNNSTDTNNNETTNANQEVETNTESPLTILISGKGSEESNGNKNTPSFKGDIKENNSLEQKHDDVTKTKTESGGFFGSIAGAISGFYHFLTGWF